MKGRRRDSFGRPGRKVWRDGFLFLCALLAIAHEARAQSGSPAELHEVSILGNLEPFTREEVLARLRTRANTRFLGIPGATPGVWLYRLGGEGEGGLARAVRRAGEAPATLNTTTLAEDRERVLALYQQEGYLGATADVKIDTLEGPDLAGPAPVRVEFHVDGGQPTFVRELRYQGLGDLRPEEVAAWLDEATLRSIPVNRDSLVFLGLDQRFSERELLEERQALIEFLRRNGYALVSRDSIDAVVYGLPGGEAPGSPPDSVDVTLRVRPGERFRFGDISFVVQGPERYVPARSDTVALGDGLATWIIEGDRRLNGRLLKRTLRFEPGDTYDFDRLLDTKQRLERAGVFSFTDIVRLKPDSTRGDTLRAPHRIGLRVRKRHGVRLEGFVLQRAGLLGTQSEELALGAGVTYRNVNVAGGGETLTLSTVGSVAGDFTDGFPTAQLEIVTALTFPGLAPPLGRLERALDPLESRTLFSLGFLIARREALGVVIRGRATAGLRLEARHDPVRTSFLDLLDFSLSDPDTLSGFSGQFLELIEDPVARRFVMEDYTRPQVNNALRYTFRSTTANPFRRDDGHTLEASVETGGNLSQFLDRFVFTPDSLEGSLPGLPFLGASAENRLEYRPYVRALLDWRRYLAGNASTFAFRVLAGVAHPTAASPVVPFDRRFYSGGASSVRGWNFRTLGPGGLTGEGVFVQGGDIKLEASAEMRRTFLHDFLRADWQVALFSDVGNVWFGPRNPGEDGGRFFFDEFYNQLGVGAGYGLRIGWDYLILRFDLAHKVHIPRTDSGLFPEGLGSPLFHFGIGQAY